MSSTHQWRTSLVWNFMLIVAVLTVVLALAPTASFAHPGHDHGLSSATGRMPGVPDYQKIGGVVSRFDPQSREYVLRKPGKPAVSAHIESDARPASEGLAANGGRSSLPPGEIQPSCATSGHRIVVVNAYDAGTKTADAEDAHIRSLVKRMNWKFVQQSQLSSNPDRTLQMKVDCDGSGATTVTDIAVPFGYKGEGIDTTDGDIGVLDTMLYVEQKLGEPEGANSVKYLIFNDKNRYPSFVGIGYKWSDATKSSSNINLQYTSSAFISRNPKHTTDGKDSWESTIPVHELLHVMGAALNYEDEAEPGKWIAAPYATTGSHCIDGIDILCYADGGTSPDGSYSEGRCPAEAGHESAERVTLDCGFDTYFDTETEPGEWLSQWWNVGGTENPFLVYTPGTPPVPTTPAAFTTVADFETYSATLKGIVNSGGVATTYKFEYGTTIAYGSSIPASPKGVGSGIDDVQVSQTIPVKPEVTYHYRIVATNSKGTFYGEDKTVKTSVWRIQDIQGPSSSGGRGNLRDVSCPSSIHCVAVGGNPPLAEQWDGSQWSVMASAKSEGSLERVSCSSASFCIATGKVGSTLFSEYWNGSSWSLVSIPAPAGSKGAAIEAISCTSSTACVAAGRYSGSKGELFEANTLIEHWNGTEWTIVPSPNVEGNAFSRLSGVSCVSATSCLAVGQANKESLSAPMPLVQKWDGSKWTLQSAPTPPGGIGSLRSVSCPAANFCMVSGAGSDAKVFTASWDGASWKVLASGMPTGLSSISCSMQSSCGLVGIQMMGRHWNGSEWTVHDLATPPGGSIAEARRVSCPGPSLCTAVGSYEGKPFFSPGIRPLAARLTPAPLPHTPLLEAEKYPAAITGPQVTQHKLTISGGSAKCNTAQFSATAATATASLSLSPAMSQCTALGLGATWNMKSCSYKHNVLNSGPPYTASMDISCSTGGDEIVITTAVCTIKIPPQSGLKGIGLENSGAGSERAVVSTYNLTAITYKLEGGCPSKSGTYTDGAYSGSVELSGLNGEGKADGFYLSGEGTQGLFVVGKESGEEANKPRVEAEKYPAAITGPQVTQHKLTISGGSAKCNKAQFSATAPAATASLSLSPAMSSCTAMGLAATWTMNSCSYKHNILNSGPPYTATMDISCSTGGDEIAITTAVCTIKIPAQSGLKSIGLENSGAGSERAVISTYNLTGITYKKEGAGCPGGAGTFKDGSYVGSTKLIGFK